MRFRIREKLAVACSRLRLTEVLEHMPHRDVLMALNYHRIGRAGDTQYDAGIFSATAEEFEDHVRYLKSRFHIATLDEAVAVAEGRPRRGASVVITFDDGYIDNYTTAFPILRSLGVPGVFFLPTAFIGTGHLPWWETIAHTVKLSGRRTIRLHYPEPAVFELDQGVNQAIASILRLYKHPKMKDHRRFCDDLADACGSGSATNGNGVERCFLNWDEAREMQKGGMAFGSHAHSHQILTTLTREQQEDEFRISREILERELRKRIDVLAYPVGKRHTFSAESVEALRDTGYRAAFSFYGGFNLPGLTKPFDIRRESICGHSMERLRLHSTMSAVAHAHWF